MAVRVQTQADLNFGNMAVQVTATHVRFQKAGANPVVKQLAAPVTVAAGAPLIVPNGLLDMVYPAGDFNNNHMRALIDPYWAGEEFQIDMLSDAATVVVDSGYGQRTYSNWAISNEND